MRTALNCGKENNRFVFTSFLALFIQHSHSIPNIALMYSKLQFAFKFLRYWLTASNGKGHRIHSPFVFDFVTNVLNDNRSFYCYETIELLRQKLKQNKTILTIEDFGAGSHLHNYKQRSVSSIARSAVKPKKWSRLLFRMVNYYQPETILELGTSLGVTTCYLASAKNNANLITMEGATAVAVIAKQNFEWLRLQNIKLITGNFDETLPSVLKGLFFADFAFVDGNHRKIPTLNYFNLLLQKVNEQSIFVFDDIHWSDDMEEAWNEIKQHDAVTVSIDLFFIGIVFFRKENKAKQHFIIRF